MLFSRRNVKVKKEDKGSLEEIVMRIQLGEDGLRESLINDYQPFVKTVVSKVCKRYIDQTMDEFSIGLLAFDQAIDHYKEGQGSKFLTFADMVIRRRLIDYIRKEARRKKHEWLDSETDDPEESEESLIHQQAALDSYQKDQESQKRREDILDYQRYLQEFGLSFEILSQQGPKHADSRNNAKHIALTLVKHPELSGNFLQTKQLPTKELLKYVSCSRKTIERNRKYIIAIALIYLGKYTSLMTYIEPESLD
ncbi:RNA polymerase sigma-I factor [Pullulanibacillus sp. KACC 23026]|uniref:RNA polymerase sigma-I factor n=1 Tax=Pullulanibacillus sp. KACC 23026 TaxID=3028315 RepID=UPI0023B0950D|nr:RNA polymerase sigma-I factor [Pullulanibacillus sp. KACC 23026]WEG13759.1 RNA polymerase sigma-I factor [Pullulanibacillus sp. KACC 23026]